MIICAESIDTHIEFASTEQKGIEQIPLADVWFWRIISVESFPLRDVSNFIEEEDSFALAFGGLSR